MTQGYFITFEGGEGVGKTTQIKLLADYLSGQGHDVVTTREPGGTDAAEEVRNLLSHKTYGGNWTPYAELMLLFAARSMHIKDVIKPALDTGKTIICDRYIDSTRVYQGYLQSIDMDFILSLEEKIVGEYVPDLTLLLDLNPEIAMSRVHDRGAGDHYDQGDISVYTTLRDGFVDLASKNNKRIKTINADQSIEDISKSIHTFVNEGLSHAL